jgi:hypothetical protein
VPFQSQKSSVGLGESDGEPMAGGESFDGLVIRFGGAETICEFIGCQKMPVFRAGGIVEIAQESVQLVLMAQGKADGHRHLFARGKSA